MAALNLNNDNLSSKQHKAIAALINEPTITAAARAVGVGERTLFTWLSEPNFAEAYRLARREAVSAAIANLQRSASDAAKVLADIMNDVEEKGATRLMAAKTVLEMSIKAVEIEDLEKRIEVLESNLKSQMELL